MPSNSVNEVQFPLLKPRLVTGAPWFALVAILLLVTMCSGCAKAKGEAATFKGTVKFDGQLVKKGSIRLSTEDDTPGPGGLSPITEGHFELGPAVGLKAGRYLVMIYGFEETGRTIKVDDAAPPRKEERQFVPREYNDNSQLRTEILPGENSEDFELVK